VIKRGGRSQQWGGRRQNIQIISLSANENLYQRIIKLHQFGQYISFDIWLKRQCPLIVS